MVRDFMRTFSQETPDRPKMPSPEIHKLRVDLIREELEELSNATSLKDYFDAILDLLYVVHGAAVSAGISPEQVERGFAEVHRSNMSKLWTQSEVNAMDDWERERVQIKRAGLRFIVRRPDGKVLKSPSYSPANLGPILKA